VREALPCRLRGAQPAADRVGAVLLA